MRKKGAIILSLIMLLSICMTSIVFADVQELTEKEMDIIVGKGTCAQRTGCTVFYNCVIAPGIDAENYTDSTGQSFYGYYASTCDTSDYGPYTVCTHSVYSTDCCNYFNLLYSLTVSGCVCP